MFTTDNCVAVIKDHPRSQYVCEEEKIKKYFFFKYRYGTSGFRGHHQTLDSVMVRVGLLAALRSFSQKGQAVGIMVTASHNDEIDNGVKIIDPSGEMLDHSWEQLSTDIANKPEDQVLALIQSKYQTLSLDDDECKNGSSATVFIGRDTRPHSLRFAQMIAQAVSSVDATSRVRDFGEVTTPQLHYIVRRANMSLSVPTITADIYLSEVLSAFKQLMRLLSQSQSQSATGKNTALASTKLLGSLMIDCANGVGGLPFKQLQQQLTDLLDLNLIHLPSPKFKVNEQCGAEHVHKQRRLPLGLQDKQAMVKRQRLASLDGDCDRLMYYFVDDNNVLQILDGDKQICLLYEFMKPYIEQCGVDLSISVVQTGYANGASLHYIEQKLGLKSVITATGVKHLHLEAKKYDISIYFEANGHGTVLIAESAVKRLQNALGNADKKKLSTAQKNAIQVLLQLHLVSNQAIGDALADVLLIEAALYGLQWDMNKWSAIYQERPSSLTKLRVKDRTVFKTANAEQTCVEPKGVQAKIDEICAKYKQSRSFVRPSGTEDVVRVYAEATSQADADEVNLLVRRAVYDLAGGVGTRP